MPSLSDASLGAVTLHRRRLASATREAEGYLELGMPAEALGALTRRHALVAGDEGACFLMGECLRAMGRFGAAVGPLRRSATLRPDDTRTWLALGWCYKRIGLLDRAIDALERAVAADPRDAIAHYNLACYYCLASRRLDAVRRLRAALRLDGSLAGLVDGEQDFARLRTDPAFRMLMHAAGWGGSDTAGPTRPTR